MKPTRAELRRVRYLAREIEADALAAAIIERPPGKFSAAFYRRRAAERAAEAFDIVRSVTAREAPTPSAAIIAAASNKRHNTRVNASREAASR